MLRRNFNLFKKCNDQDNGSQPKKTASHNQSKKATIPRLNQKGANVFVQQGKQLKQNIYKLNLDTITSDSDSDQDSPFEKKPFKFRKDQFSDHSSVDSSLEKENNRTNDKNPNFIYHLLDLIFCSTCIAFSFYGFFINHFVRHSYSFNELMSTTKTTYSFQQVDLLESKSFFKHNFQQVDEIHHQLVASNNNLHEAEYDLKVHRTYFFTKTMGILVNFVVILLIIKRIIESITNDAEILSRQLLISANLLPIFYFVSI